MTKEQIIKRIEQIKEMADCDYEVAHGMEDDLFEQFIADIALGFQEDVVECANLIIKSKEISFYRHCA